MGSLENGFGKRFILQFAAMTHVKHTYQDWVARNPAEYAGRYLYFVAQEPSATKRSEIITIKEFNALSLSKRITTVYATVTCDAEDGTNTTTVIPSPQIRGTRFEGGPDCFGRFVKRLPAAKTSETVEKGLLLNNGQFYARIGGNG